MTDKGWQRRFEDPIALDGGAALVTLEDAARHIQNLAEADQQHPHWQLAVAVLIDCAEGRDFRMHARIAVLRALNHGRPDPAPRRKRAKAYRILTTRVPLS
jgi:hypothetical protein